MRTVPVALGGGRAYEVAIGASLEELGKQLAALVPGRQSLVVSNRNVARMYAKPLLRGLAAAGFRARLALIPDGERYKRLATAAKLYREAVQAKLDRRSPLIALGGGVVTDVAGFVAGTFMRGVPFVPAPTTLLGMVDAAVGGKTGVDLPEGKNLVGVFWQPRLVWIDLAPLRTLSERQWRTGMAEIIKYGLIRKPQIIDRLERTDLESLRKDPAAVEALVAESVTIKADVVAKDERETLGQREILNLGHTFAHGIEAVTNYRGYTHGEAVAVGLAAAARLAERMGGLSTAERGRLEALLSAWKLPTRAKKKLSRRAILSAMARDKKNWNGRFRFVLPDGWGSVKVTGDVNARDLEATLDEVGL